MPSCSAIFYGLLTVTFPPFDYFAVAARRLGRCHHVHAHVWAHVVVEVHGLPNGLPDLFHGTEAHTLQKLVLHRRVDALGNGVLLGVPVLGHADPYPTASQSLHILPAGVLDAPVAVVDERATERTSRVAEAVLRHLESLERIGGAQVGADGPAYYLVAVGVGHQAQVAEHVVGVVNPHGNVRDVGHPQLVDGGGDELSDKVGEQGQTVRGVGRAGSAHLSPHLQAVPVDDVLELVTPNPVNAGEGVLVHVPQLHAADAGVHGADGVDELKGERLLRRLSGGGGPVALVVGLLAHAKQLAQRPDGVCPRVACMQVLYRLAPAFFLIWIWNFFSATLIISS